MAKTSTKPVQPDQPDQPAQRDAFTGPAWSVKRVEGGYQVVVLFIRQGEVVSSVPAGEPNMKELGPPVIEGLVADYLVGGTIA